MDEHGEYITIARCSQEDAKVSLAMLQPIVCFKLIPSFVESSKNCSANHSLFSSSCLGYLYLLAMVNECCSGWVVYLVRMYLGDGLHVYNLYLVRHHQVTHVDFIPPCFGP